MVESPLTPVHSPPIVTFESHSPGTSKKQVSICLKQDTKNDSNSNDKKAYQKQDDSNRHLTIPKTKNVTSSAETLTDVTVISAPSSPSNLSSVTLVGSACSGSNSSSEKSTDDKDKNSVSRNVSEETEDTPTAKKDSAKDGIQI